MVGVRLLPLGRSELLYLSWHGRVRRKTRHREFCGWHAASCCHAELSTEPGVASLRGSLHFSTLFPVFSCSLMQPGTRLDVPLSSSLGTVRAESPSEVVLFYEGAHYYGTETPLHERPWALDEHTDGLIKAVSEWKATAGRRSSYFRAYFPAFSCLCWSLGARGVEVQPGETEACGTPSLEHSMCILFQKNTKNKKLQLANLTWSPHVNCQGEMIF